ncbi:MAG: hypothetical protein AABN34_18555 [Acidobacteriota bacterium]
MSITSFPASRLREAAAISGVYDHINKTCLVIIDRSMWFAKSYEALADNNFQLLVRKHQRLAGQEDNFREPVIFAFNYAQRVFLCSAMELCLMHQHSNSVALLAQLLPERMAQLKHLQALLKRRYKKYQIKSWGEWAALDRSVQLEHLRELSFANLEAAATLFGDIYGSACFDLAWGEDEHRQLAEQYGDYQTLRNGILHRGGEFSSGARIEATETDISTTFEDTKRFQDAILRLSDWCRVWWIGQLAETPAKEQ